MPVPLANVDIVSVASAAPTDFTGQYVTGYHTAGTYTVSVSAPGYESTTITGVVLVNGEVTLLDIDLVPLVSFALQGIVLEQNSNEPVEGALVRLKSPIYDYTTEAGPDGTFVIPAMFADDYAVLAGQWGWRTECPSVQPIDGNTGMLTIHLAKGWYDDFVLDFGWMVTTNASSGDWERGVPVGTTSQGEQSNPGADVSGDCGAMAYVTGNAGGSAGADDVDDGNTVLTSPLFDGTTMWDPHLFYHRWFFNAGGSGSPNDLMRISISNGSTTVVIENITTSASAWTPVDIRILDHIALTTTMQLSVYISDDEPGHLVEGGVDRFEVVEMSPVAVHGSEMELFRLWPNPSNGGFEIGSAGLQGSTIDVIDALGRTVHSVGRVDQDNIQFDLELPDGPYHLRITTKDGHQSVLSLIVAN